ncbi:MAG: VWA domain-containing protein [Candidatus Acidiferrales bacterium]
MNPRTAPALVVAFTLIVAAGELGLLGATHKLATPQAQTDSRLNSTTRMVQVSVLVQDKHGDPIPGLNKDDFTLLDEKQPQAIQFFSVHTNAIPERQPDPLPPHTYTNRLAERAAVPKSVTLILLDALNTDFSSQEYSRRQVIRFLGQLKPEDRVGIYTLDYQLHVLHDFTTDSTALLAAVKNYQGNRLPDVSDSQPHEADATPQRLRAAADVEELKSFLNATIEREANFYIYKRVLITANALESIARHVGSLPGRKNLVWVSGSFPINVGFDDPFRLIPAQFHDQLDFRASVDRVVRAMNEANIAVYPVDARGLVPADSGIQSQYKLRNRNTAPADLSLNDNPQYLATMSVLAERTGGRIFYGSNDIFEAVRRAVADSAVTYELGYYPQGVSWDGKFHSIHVAVKSPGAKVRARTGYFARPERAITEQERDAFVVAAAYSPIEATTIGLNVKVRAADVPGAEQMNVSLHLDPRDLSFQQADGAWVANAEVVYAQTDETGKLLDAPNANLKFSLKPDQYEELKRSGISYATDVNINRHAAQLRIIVRDYATGAVGSVDIPLKDYFVSANQAH